MNQWCRARGKPDPVVTCHKDGTTILMRQPCVVSRNHSGTYWCSASNALGTIGRSVSVTVECEWRGGGTCGAVTQLGR